MPDAHYTDDLAPSYALVARKIHHILSEMSVNERLPSERKLAEELGVSRVTLRRSLDYFQRQGILHTRPGGGTWLARPVEPIVDKKSSPVPVIGLLVETVENPMIARIVRGAEKFASSRGYHLAVAHDYGDIEHQIAQIRRMKAGAFGGVAIFPDTRYDLDCRDLSSALRDLVSAGIPLVFIDRRVKGVDAPVVMTDNFQGSYLATQHMLSVGYRRLGLLGFGGKDHEVNLQRRDGFLAALKDAGLPPEPVVHADLGTHDYENIAREVVRGWVQAKKSPLPFDGLVCMQDNMAYGAFLALRDAKIAVPQVGLIGFDNLNRELYQASGLELSSVDQRAEKIGDAVAAKLFALIEGEESPHKAKVLLKPRLVVRASSSRGGG